MNIVSYGGGVQTVAMCLLVARGLLPRPDRIVFADTGREVASTAAYRRQWVEPLLAKHNLVIEDAPHDLAAVDLYAHNGDLLLPVFTRTGKLSTYCSTEWKARVVQRYLRGNGVASASIWIGFSLDERRRVHGGKPDRQWPRSYPLIDLMLTRGDCERLITSRGWPLPNKSRCWMCPHQSNAEWRTLTSEEWAQAVALDEEIRAADQRDGVFLHRSLMPLAEVDLSVQDRVVEGGVACGFGGCWI